MQVVLDDSSNPYQTPSRRKSRTLKIGLGIIIGVVVGNAVGYGAHRFILMQEAAEFTVNDEEREQTHRRAALHAMEREDYDVAVRELSAALRTASPASDLTRLLAMAQEFRREQKEPSSAEQDESEQESLADSAEEPSLRTGEPAIPAKPTQGLLLVTTTPPRMTIYIDGEVMDMSPARFPLDPGTYQVALKYGKKELFKRRLRIRPGAKLHVNPDYTKEVAALIAPKPAPPKVAANAEPEGNEVVLPPPDIIEVGVGDLPGSSTATSSLLAELEASAAKAESSSEAADGLATIPSLATPDVTDQSVTKDTDAAPPISRADRLLSKAVVHQVVSASHARFQRCYRLGLESDPTLEGYLDIEMEVRSNGKVKKGRVTDSTLRGVRVAPCIEHELKRLVFPFRPKGKLQVVSSRLEFLP